MNGDDVPSWIEDGLGIQGETFLGSREFRPKWGTDIGIYYSKDQGQNCCGVCPTAPTLTVTISGVLSCGCVNELFSGDSDIITDININGVFTVSGGPPIWSVAVSSIASVQFWAHSNCPGAPDSTFTSNGLLVVGCGAFGIPGWHVRYFDGGSVIDYFFSEGPLSALPVTLNNFACGVLLPPGFGDCLFASGGTAVISP